MARRSRKQSLPPGCTWNRHGLIAWRYTDPQTGKRPVRSTGTKDPAIAGRIVAAWQEELERKRAGLPDYSAWQSDLLPLAEQWLEVLAQRLSPRWLQQRRSQIHRALEQLELRTTGDLLDIGKLNQRIQRLKLSDVSTRRLYQDPLRQFAKWLAEDSRLLEYDPLANWRPIQYERVRVPRRAFRPDEVAMALWGERALAQLRDRPRDLSLLWRVLLVTGPRILSLCERDVRHYRPRQRRIDFGKGPKNKRRGAGALDDTTASEIEESIEGRGRNEPLLLTVTGKRLSPDRVLDDWRGAFGMGVLAELVPGTELATLYAAFRRLIAPIHHGRNRPPPLPKDSLALEIVEDFGEDWSRRMLGIDVHCFKRTHRTWARARDVASEAIDVQLGHASGDAETLSIIRSIRGTGARHYTDMDAFDPRATAIAVRAVLDRAEQDLAEAEAQDDAGVA